MNSVCLLGRLVKDPNVVEYGKGKDAGLCARITVAVQRDKDNADFISCVAFGKTAELIDTYFSKGSRIALEGRIQTGKYEDKDNVTHWTTDVVIMRLHFCDSKKTDAPDDFDDEEEDDLPPDWKKEKKNSRTSGRSRK